jgi:flagellar basal body P-ring formation protein FlgA
MKKNSLKICLFAFGFLTAANAQQEQALQSHESIYAAVTDYVAQRIGSNDYETSLAPLDSLLKLSACPTPLEVFTINDLIRPGRNSIGVRCNSANKWSLYVSALIKTYESVLVLTKPVQRGETITRLHLSSERRDVSSLRGDYITQIEQVESKQVVRPMQNGTILSTRNIAEPKLIKRGDKIIISSARSSFAIRMNGTAMMDGVKGQSIRIKNQSSGRIINARVIESGLASVDH